MKKKQETNYMLELAKQSLQARQVARIYDSLSARKAVDMRVTPLDEFTEYRSYTDEPCRSNPKRLHHVKAMGKLSSMVSHTNKAKITERMALLSLESYILWLAGKIAHKYGLTFRVFEQGKVGSCL